ncbi:serine/arginine repetitive matrix protein 1-like [Hyaena hyaena]|uniref:serine/arginine repetitive matrix protein 1-like n=1 Tax=Hyaena hyaena TaxID=95912 RepID=UPI001924914D|nr:serine/arginine repetitive matrix protein 1-like [Hyaena hyaena]
MCLRTGLCFYQPHTGFPEAPHSHDVVPVSQQGDPGRQPVLLLKDDTVSPVGQFQRRVRADTRGWPPRGLASPQGRTALLSKAGKASRKRLQPGRPRGRKPPRSERRSRDDLECPQLNPRCCALRPSLGSLTEALDSKRKSRPELQRVPSQRGRPRTTARPSVETTRLRPHDSERREQHPHSKTRPSNETSRPCRASTRTSRVRGQGPLQPAAPCEAPGRGRPRDLGPRGRAAPPPSDPRASRTANLGQRTVLRYRPLRPVHVRIRAPEQTPSSGGPSPRQAPTRGGGLRVASGAAPSSPPSRHPRGRRHLLFSAGVQRGPARPARPALGRPPAPPPPPSAALRRPAPLPGGREATHRGSQASGVQQPFPRSSAEWAGGRGRRRAPRRGARGAGRVRSSAPARRKGAPPRARACALRRGSRSPKPAAGGDSRRGAPGGLVPGGAPWGLGWLCGEAAGTRVKKQPCSRVCAANRSHHLPHDQLGHICPQELQGASGRSPRSAAAREQAQNEHPRASARPRARRAAPSPKALPQPPPRLAQPADARPARQAPRGRARVFCPRRRRARARSPRREERARLEESSAQGRKRESRASGRPPRPAPLAGALDWLQAGEPALSRFRGRCLKGRLSVRLPSRSPPPPPPRLPPPPPIPGASPPSWLAPPPPPRTAVETAQRGRRDPHGKMAAADPGGRAELRRGSAAGRGGAGQGRGGGRGGRPG